MLNILETVRDTGLVSKDHLWETTDFLFAYSDTFTV